MLTLEVKFPHRQSFLMIMKKFDDGSRYGFLIPQLSDEVRVPEKADRDILSRLKIIHFEMA